MLPSTFLPPAEDSELIVQIGNWVLHAACAQAEIWRRSGITIPLSVNISARELTELDLAERVREELAYCRLPGPRPVPGDQRGGRAARPRARPLGAEGSSSASGVLIALDNFGFGQFSLGLPEQPAARRAQARPRADRELSTSDKERRAMFAATIALAKEAGLTAVAVGIETNRQLALARELDCAVGQGFLLHGPASPDRVRLRDASRVGNVRPMAPSRATARQRPRR